MLYDNPPAPPVDCTAVALVELDPALMDKIPVPEDLEDVGASVLIIVEPAENVLAEVESPFAAVVEISVGSEDIEVRMVIETAVAFPTVRTEVGTAASGDAVRGSLKMLQISAMASNVATRWSAKGGVRQDDRKCD